jgi:hypothetical protein
MLDSLGGESPFDNLMEVNSQQSARALPPGPRWLDENAVDAKLAAF